MPGALGSLYLDKLPVHLEEKANTVLSTTFFALSRVENPTGSSPLLLVQVQTRKCATFDRKHNKPKRFNILLTPLTSCSDTTTSTTFTNHQLPHAQEAARREQDDNKMMSRRIPSTLRLYRRELLPARFRLKINQLASLGRSLTVTIYKFINLGQRDSCLSPGLSFSLFKY